MQPSGEKRRTSRRGRSYFPFCSGQSLSPTVIQLRRGVVPTSLLLDEVAQSFRQSVDVDRHLRLDLFHPLVDLGLNREASVRISGCSEEELHVLDHLVPATASASGVLRRVLHSAVESQVLSDPVVHQTRDVLQERSVVRSTARLHRHSSLEGDEDLAVHLALLLIRPCLGLGHSSVQLAVNAEDRNNSLKHHVALSHDISIQFYCVGQQVIISSVGRDDICSVLAYPLASPFIGNPSFGVVLSAQTLRWPHFSALFSTFQYVQHVFTCGLPQLPIRQNTVPVQY